MSNKKNKEVVNHDSESEEEQDLGSEQDSDVDSEGNYVGEKVMLTFVIYNSNLETHGLHALFSHYYYKYLFNFRFVE